MPFSTSPEVGSPVWWLRHLDKMLYKRQPSIDLYNAYYDGEHRLLYATDRFKREFGQMLKHLNDNWCELVADAVDERLGVTGFLFGEEKAADSDAWEIWQRNQLDAEAQTLHIESLVCADACAMVWADDENKSQARITVEAADQAVVAYAPGDTHRRVAGLKRWVDEDVKMVFGTLYLPGYVYKFQAPYTEGGNYDPAHTRWEDRDRRFLPSGETWYMPNPFGVVPLVPFKNRPRIGKPGRSELANVIPKQDAANKLLADMMVASEFGAFRQRWATGVELPVDPDTHEVLEPFKAAIDRLWLTKDKDARFGEFEQTDLRVYVAAIEMLVQHIASQTRTPPHYFYLSGQFPSGESIKSAETGLVAKTRRKMLTYGEAWEEVMRLAFVVEGRDAARFVSAQTLWSDPESRSESEHIDAVVKKVALRVPLEQLWKDAGYTPQEIEAFKNMTPPPEPPQFGANGANPGNGMNGAQPEPQGTTQSR